MESAENLPIRQENIGVYQFRYYAVFDGHGGPFKLNHKHVAKYCVDNLHNKMEKYLSVINLCVKQLAKRQSALALL